MTFVERAENVVLIGLSGVGKTPLTLALGYRVAKAGIKTRFTIVADLLMTVSVSHAQSQLNDTLQRSINAYRLLIINEIGF